MSNLGSKQVLDFRGHGVSHFCEVKKGAWHWERKEWKYRMRWASTRPDGVQSAVILVLLVLLFLHSL